MDKRTKTSEAFKLAKSHLKPIGDCTYICHALFEAATGKSIRADYSDWTEVHKTRKPGFKTAIKTISSRIGSDNPLELWLQIRGIKHWNYVSEQMQAYRHRWLDALIAEFEAKGD